MSRSKPSLYSFGECVARYAVGFARDGTPSTYGHLTLLSPMRHGDNDQMIEPAQSIVQHFSDEELIQFGEWLLSLVAAKKLGKALTE